MTSSTTAAEERRVADERVAEAERQAAAARAEADRLRASSPDATDIRRDTTL